MSEDRSDRSQVYKQAGVDLNSGNSLISAIKDIANQTPSRGVLSEIGGFAGLFRPDFINMKDPILVASTDGVGTKIKLAIACNKHDTIGIDLVAMSANDILVQGALPLFFLDYFACNQLDVETTKSVISGIAAGCRLANCALLGGETAEMPGFYTPGEYDLAGFCVGMVENNKRIDGSSIRIGDKILGIASSGLHSNGYSLVRKILEEKQINLQDKVPQSEQTFAETLLTPTHIYVEPIKHLMRDIDIAGMVHITGGGFYDNIPRILHKNIAAEINLNWQMPAIFHWLKEAGKLDLAQMLQIFNCGIGLILILHPRDAEDCLGRLLASGWQTWEIGKIIASKADSEQVIINF